MWGSTIVDPTQSTFESDETDVVADTDGGFSVTAAGIVNGEWYSVFCFDLTEDAETWNRGGWRVQATT